MNIRSAYTPHDPADFAISFEGAGRTIQSMKKECDINRILERFEKTGILTHKNEHQGRYGDFSNVPGDFHAAVNQVKRAQLMFDSLPSSIREQFNNDPGKFLDFATNPENQAEMVTLGLLEPPDAPEGNLEGEGTENSQAAVAAGSEPATGDPTAAT